MFPRFIVSASLLAAIGLGFGGNWVYSYQKVSAYKNEILHLQDFCSKVALTPTFATVREVRDGDTFYTTSKAAVRLVGSDSPEICKMDSKGNLKEVGCVDEPGAKAATAFLKKLIEGKEVVLVGDPVYGDEDFFNRKLRYVYVGDTMVDMAMISKGYAPVYSELKKTAKFYDALKKAQATAQEKKLGIWGDGSAEKLGLK
jgi:endonuclease YncB( thermonuclease family)